MYLNLHTLRVLGREHRLLPESSAANIATRLLPFHPFHQQLFCERAA